MLFNFSGIVQHNLGRGRELGYPTANIAVDIDSPEGIFVGYSYVGTRKLQSLIFIGSPLTFGEKDKKAEIYILDFDEDLYGKELQVDVLKKLRENLKFSSVEQLVEQIQKDEIQGRAFFAQQ